MVSATPALVLSALKFGDTSLIVRMYTAQFGLQSYLLKGILGKKKGGLKAGHFQPLTQLDIVGSSGREGKLGYLREAHIAYPYQTVHTDIRKSTVALFLSEVLSGCLRESEPDEGLFEYLCSALQWLDHQNQIANFHIRFLIGLTRFLGLYPDLSAKDAPIFDLREGAFLSKTTLNPSLEGKQLTYFVRFLESDFDSISQIPMNQESRRELLKGLIQFYELHIPGFRKPRSLDVFDTVFS
jgi:DNA repair protein RecO (recombination protein O)